MTTDDSSAIPEEPSCTRCGGAAHAGSRFCASCGARIPLLRQGQVIDAKYEIEQRLSHGEQSEVYKVRHLHLDEPRIIKIFHADPGGSGSDLLRFRQEAKLASRVSHPNVAAMHDFSTLPDGSFYMVWEFLDGRTVSGWKEAGEPLDPLEAIDVTLQVLSGLEALHALGIVHRDVSPDNIMVRRGDDHAVHAKIIDLGIAKSLDKPEQGLKTEIGTFVGKAKYTSPEQAGFLREGETIDGRTDIYSLGITLFEMLTGRAPFEAPTRELYIARHLSSVPPPLSEAAPDLQAPPSLEDAVARALKKDREQRFATAAEFRDALTSARADLAPLVQRRATSAGAESQDEAASPTAAAVAAAAALLAASRSRADAVEHASDLQPSGAGAGDAASIAAVDHQPSADESVGSSDTGPAAAVAAAASGSRQPSAAPERPSRRVVQPPLRQDLSGTNEYNPLSQKRMMTRWLGPIIFMVIALGALALAIRKNQAPPPIHQPDPVVVTEATPPAQQPAATLTASGTTGNPQAAMTTNEAAGVEPPQVTVQVPQTQMRPQPSRPAAARRPAAAQPQRVPVAAASPPAAPERRPDPAPAQQPSQKRDIIPEREAVGIALSRVRSSGYYDVPPDCIQTGSVRYVNVGYTIQIVTDACGAVDSPRSLGYWRVDALTGETFVRNASGRFVSPR